MTELTDLEITRLCAKAMGWHVGGLASKHVAFKVNNCAIIAGNDRGGESVYDPLHDDAQCFALVKRFRLNIEAIEVDYWSVINEEDATKHGHDVMKIGSDKSLNRAVCICVAQMELAKAKV